MPDARRPGELDPASLLRDLDGPRPLSPALHQRLTDELLSAAGDATQVLALTPELSSRLTGELQAQSPAADEGVVALDRHRRAGRGQPGGLADLRSRWTIGTSAAAAVVLLLVAVAGIVFHPGASGRNHGAATASGSAASGAGVSSGAQLYPNSASGLGATTSPSSSTSLPAPSAAALGSGSTASNGSTTSGGSGDSSAGGFAGAAAPAPSPSVSSVSPGQGPVTGGTEVTITGEGLSDATAVHFGSSSATSVQVVSPTEVRAVAPAHLPGTVDVVVVTPEGLSTTSAADRFTYTAGGSP